MCQALECLCTNTLFARKPLSVKLEGALQISLDFRELSFGWNGDINSLEAAKLLEENTYSFGRVHCGNYCLNNAGKFSCAVDCLLELCYGVFYSHLHSNDIICESCNQSKNLGAIDIVREPVWLWLRDRCISFSPMSADTVFSDIFTLFTVGVLSEDLKSFFVAQQCNQSCCTSCGNQIIYNTNIFVLYISCQI